jgi:hypothetical protein
MFNIFDLFILAAKNNDRDYSWVVPVFFAVVWVLVSIGKFSKAAYDNWQQRQKQDYESDSAQAGHTLRYKPIPDAAAKRREIQTTIPVAVPVPRNRDRMPAPALERSEPKPPGAVASLKKAMHEAMEEVAGQQAKSQMPKPVAARPKAARVPTRTQSRATRKAPPVARKAVQPPQEKKQPVQQQETILSGLWQKENIRKAIIYSEIIGKPLALRDC